MVFQKVLKGISGLNDTDAKDLVDNGIMSNWWRRAGTISPSDIKLHLTQDNLKLHLNHYHDPVPSTNPLHAIHNGKFGEVSPFISTSAGAVERDFATKTNLIFPPFITALNFATRNGRADGYIFYAYLLTVGKIAVEMEQFSEEMRNLYVYRDYQPYYRQGEVMAKVLIPSVQIQKVEGYRVAEAQASLKAGNLPAPHFIYINPTYIVPEKLSNIQEVVQ